MTTFTYRSSSKLFYEVDPWSQKMWELCLMSSLFLFSIETKAKATGIPETPETHKKRRATQHGCLPRLLCDGDVFCINIDHWLIRSPEQLYNQAL